PATTPSPPTSTRRCPGSTPSRRARPRPDRRREATSPLPLRRSPMSRSRRPDPRRPGARWPRVSPAALLLALAVAGPAPAHDGHAALPSKGATVDGDRLLLSEAAREAIGLELGEVTLEDLRRPVRARARVALPWSQQAMITTLVPGRIARVSARPGEAVEPG